MVEDEVIKRDAPAGPGELHVGRVEVLHGGCGQKHLQERDTIKVYADDFGFALHSTRCSLHSLWSGFRIIKEVLIQTQLVVQRILTRKILRSSLKSKTMPARNNN